MLPSFWGLMPSSLVRMALSMGRKILASQGWISQGTGIGGADGWLPGSGGRGAVILYLDAIQYAGVGPARPDRGKIALTTSMVFLHFSS